MPDIILKALVPKGVVCCPLKDAKGQPKPLNLLAGKEHVLSEFDYKVNQVAIAGLVKAGFVAVQLQEQPPKPQVKEKPQEKPKIDAPVSEAPKAPKEQEKPKEKPKKA